MKCKHTNKEGQPCKANAMTGQEYCYFHNPAISKDEKRLAQTRGGANRGLTVIEPSEPMQLETAKDVRTLLADTINRVRAKRLDVRIANCLGILSGHLIKAIETDSIEDRVEKIERVILERKTLR